METPERKAESYFKASAEIREELEALGYVEPTPEEVLEACREVRKELADERRRRESAPGQDSV